eukprot:TRINITY_DN42_c0_g1_i1.p1 TRINITY_DN42_c0_g1~~TRINITY_DN42_c0_g1_i1.p1  ORF type:complete len:214 (+),score=20.16 TRINITY_DN42_c0_g1_i1:17-658(+)
MGQGESYRVSRRAFLTFNTFYTHTKMRAIVYVAFVLIFAALVSAQSLIVRKDLQNVEVTTGRDLVVTIELFNTGKVPVYDVNLNDERWDDKFENKVGLTSASWERINPDTNVSHTYVLKPKAVEANTVVYTYPALVSFREGSAKGDRTIVYSTSVGPIHVWSRTVGDSKRSQPHFQEWALFSLFAATALVLPLAAWNYLRTHYTNGIATKKKN